MLPLPLALAPRFSIGLKPAHIASSRAFEWKGLTFRIAGDSASVQRDSFIKHLCPNESGWWQGELDWGWQTLHLFVDPKTLRSELRGGPSRDFWLIDAFTPTAQAVKTSTSAHLR